jgi:uncharacterized membrane protein (UPF0127 family)
MRFNTDVRQIMKARNVRNNRELSNNVDIADTFYKRMKGLLGKSEMLTGEALWIKPCNSIHTFLMRFPIDVIFLNKNNKVIATKKKLRPNRLTRIYPKAVGVLELPAGTVEATATVVGDVIEIK